MRVTNNMIFNTLTSDLAKANEKLMKTFETIASGKRVNRPSDDPVASAQILEYRDIISSTGQFKRNIGAARDYLVGAETAVLDVSATIQRLQELAIGQATGTATADTRLDTSFEVRELFEHLVSLGNTKTGDRYIFSGNSFTTKPFDLTGAYSGDAGESTIRISPDTVFTYGIPGENIFQGVGVTGGVDILQITSDLQTALENNDIAGIESAIDGLSQSLGQIGNKLAEIGARMNRIDSQEANIDSFINETLITLANIETADIGEVTSNLSIQQTTLEILQSVTAKALQTSIFNFIQ